MKKTLAALTSVATLLFVLVMTTDVGAQAYIRSSRFIANGIITTAKLANGRFSENARLQQILTGGKVLSRKFSGLHNRRSEKLSERFALREAR